MVCINDGQRGGLTDMCVSNLSHFQKVFEADFHLNFFFFEIFSLHAYQINQVVSTLFYLSVDMSFQHASTLGPCNTTGTMKYHCDHVITCPIRPCCVFCRGGIRLLIVGTGFDSVVEPKLVLELPGDEMHVVSSTCLVLWFSSHQVLRMM